MASLDATDHEFELEHDDGYNTVAGRECRKKPVTRASLKKRRDDRQHLLEGCQLEEAGHGSRRCKNDAQS